MGKKFDMLALGEVLLRLSPEGNERLTQGTRFEKQLGGAELNVAVGAANLGLLQVLSPRFHLMPLETMRKGRSEETVLTRITWLEMTVQIPDWEFTITNMAQILVNRRWFTTASILL